MEAKRPATKKKKQSRQTVGRLKLHRTPPTVLLPFVFIPSNFNLLSVVEMFEKIKMS